MFSITCLEMIKSSNNRHVKTNDQIPLTLCAGSYDQILRILSISIREMNMKSDLFRIHLQYDNCISLGPCVTRDTGVIVSFVEQAYVKDRYDTKRYVGCFRNSPVSGKSGQFLFLHHKEEPLLYIPG